MYSIGFDIFAKDRGSPAFTNFGNTVATTEGKFSKFKTASIVSTAAVSAAVVGFATSSVNKFKEVGTETLGLMRVLGGTSEDASRLRFAASQVGLSYETMVKSTRKLSSALETARGSTKATAGMAGLLGTKFLDAHGKILPMADLLPKISDKFMKMPAGAEKTALAMKLFGKAGTDMLPFLNKGSAGLAALEKSSDKYGMTLSGKMLDSLKKSKAGQRDWNATLDGLKVQFGAQVLPIITSFATLLRDKVIPVVQKVTAFLQQHSGAAKMVFTIVGSLIASLKVLTIVQGVLNTVMAANPFLLIVVGLALLAAGIIYAYKHSETFRDIVQDAFAKVKTAVNVCSGVISTLVGVFSNVISWVRTNWPLLLAIITGPIGLAVYAIVKNFDTIKSVASSVIIWVRTNWPLLLAIITGPIGLAVYAIVKNFDTIKSVASSVIIWVRTNWPLLLAIITGPIGLAVYAIAKNWGTIKDGASSVVTWISGRFDAVVGFVSGMPGRIASKASGMWHGITDAFRSAINDIIRGWNSLHFSISIPKFHVKGTNMDIGGKSLDFGVPYVTPLARGGMSTGPTNAIIGDNPSGREAVLPLDSPHTISALSSALALAGAGRRDSVPHIDVHVHVGGSVVAERDLTRLIMNEIEKVQKRMGVPTIFGQAA